MTRRGVSPVGVLALVCLVIGCKSVDPAFQDSQGRPLEDLTPAPYRIAIAPVDLADGPLERPQQVGEDGEVEEDGLYFAFSPEQMQVELAAALMELEAGSDVVTVGADDIAEAQEQHADLLIRPRVRKPAELEHLGRSERWGTSGLLWITTWLGSFWVEDSTYSAEMELDFEIVNPWDSLPVDSITASSATADMAYWDRNPFMSWGTLQSVIIPPFWTSDDVETTSLALSETVCDRLAARLTRYLKEELHTTEGVYLGQMRLESPENGAQVGERISVKGRLITREPVTDFFIYLNDSDEPLLEMTGDSIPPSSAQQRGNVFQLLFDETVDLAEGSNLIALEIGISGRFTSRTIVVHNGSS